MKKWARLIAATLAFSLIAAACGDSSDSSDSGSEAATETTTGSTEAPSTTAAPTTAAPTTAGGTGHVLDGADLTVWGWASSEAEDTQLTGVIDGINEATGANATFEPQPEYDTALQAALVAGQPPDVFYVDSGKLPDLVASGALAPIPDGAISNPVDIYASLRGRLLDRRPTLLSAERLLDAGTHH
ncbi:MAG: extracellular solute-binding protein [Acidimicrobiales bacterium]